MSEEKQEAKEFVPCWMYHKTKEPLVVKSADELKNLGSAWADSPAAFEEKAKPQQVKE